jgi:serine/threonine protein kinase
MNEKADAIEATEQLKFDEPIQVVSVESADVTQAYDSSTKTDNNSVVPAPMSELPAEQTEPSVQQHQESLPFLQPGTQPGSLGRLSHFEVLKILGKGGFGIVLKAFDEKLRRMVAIKALGPQLTGSANARSRFVREARTAASVNSKYVVATYEVYEQPIPFLVMEYVAGITLQARIHRREPFAIRDILRIGGEMAEGLAAAHHQGLIHRDIKPANILLEDRNHSTGDNLQLTPIDDNATAILAAVENRSAAGRVKIADFGLARAVDDVGLTQSGMIAGTPHFMSPEQARGETLDHRSDLFSLGSVLYAMCTGHPPFRAHKTIGVMKRVCDDTPWPIREINPAIPESLAAVVNQLLEKDPARRIQTAAEVAEKFEHQLAHLDEATLSATSYLFVDDEAMADSPAILTRSKASSQIKRSRPRWQRVAAAAVLFAGIVLAVTEFAGLTHLFRAKSRTDSNQPDDQRQVANNGTPTPLPNVVNPNSAEPKKPPVSVVPKRAMSIAERYAAVLQRQDAPKDNAERLAFAKMAYEQKKFSFATRLWAEALDSDPKLGDDRQAQHRYAAACAAALAADGKGQDEPTLDEAAKAKLRGQALEWLKAERLTCKKLLEYKSQGQPAQPNVVQKLGNWRKDNDLASIRDAAALAKLPPDERAAFEQLWADVGALDTLLLLQTAAPPLLATAARQAWLGEDKELAATCERALQFGMDTQDPTMAERTAKICSLRQANAKTHDAALVLARRAVDLGKRHVYFVYFQMCLGMAEYRSGNYAEAEAALLTAARLGTNHYIISVTSAFYRAMTLFKQGKETEARRLALDAVAKMHPIPTNNKNLANTAGADDLILWMAYREAKALIQFDKPVSTPERELLPLPKAN